jgi:signal transduction histidine kinase
MAILSRMEFGKDGYFFVYDVAGNNLATPVSQSWSGKT